MIPQQNETILTAPPRSVLIVEDEALIALELQELIEAAGIRVVGRVDTGEAAIEACHAKAPELVLMDIRLKGTMTGIEVARRLLPESTLAIVFITAHSDEATAHEAKLRNAYGYLIKPFSEREVLVTIEMATMRHRLEREIANRQKTLDAMLKSIGDGILATDASGTVVFMNPAGETITGWNSQDAVGRSLDDVFQLDLGSASPSETGPWREAIRRREVIHLPMHSAILRRDGSRRAIEDSVAPVISSDGEIIGVILAFKDVQEQRNTEVRLRQLEERFARAQRMEAIGRVAGFAAHDFNNLLTIISGAAQLLHDSSQIGGLERKLCEGIVQATKRAENATRQLLGLTRVERAPTTRFRPRAVFERLAPLLERMVGSSIRLQTSLRDQFLPVRFNESRFEQILLNLLVNARDAMPEGGTIAVKMRDIVSEDIIETQKSSTHSVEITIADDGEGMSEETVARATEPFFSTKPHLKGSGLGLAFVSDVVQEAGGTLQIESEPGRGTKVTLQIPAAKTEAEHDVQRDPRSVQARTTTLRILLIEDEQDLRGVLTEYLRSCGHRTEGCSELATDIEQSVARLGAVDLIISDVVMPTRSGPSVVMQLLRDWPQAEVIFISGYVPNSLSLQLGRLREPSFLQKPFSLQQLAEEIERIMARE